MLIEKFYLMRLRIACTPLIPQISQTVSQAAQLGTWEMLKRTEGTVTGAGQLFGSNLTATRLFPRGNFGFDTNQVKMSSFQYY